MKYKRLTIAIIIIAVCILNIIVLERLGYWMFVFSFSTAFIVAWFIEPISDAAQKYMESKYGK